MHPTTATPSTATVGVIGLGQIGGHIAANLVSAGYQVSGHDIREAARKQASANGVALVGSADAVLAKSDMLLTSLVGDVSSRLYDQELIPNARALPTPRDKVFVDFSTLPAPEARRIGGELHDLGCRYLDAPVSGGTTGAAAGQLRVFVGGERATADCLWPLLQVIGDPAQLHRCGPVGSGQAAKAVQQLSSRFPDVARMEVLAYGLRAGLSLSSVRGVLDLSPQSEAYRPLCDAIERGDTDELSAQFSEWRYYLDEADDRGFAMPMLRAMYDHCREAPHTSTDRMGRPMPSIWQCLMEGQQAPGA